MKNTNVKIPRPNRADEGFASVTSLWARDSHEHLPRDLLTPPPVCPSTLPTLTPTQSQSSSRLTWPFSTAIMAVNIGNVTPCPRRRNAFWYEYLPTLSTCTPTSSPNVAKIGSLSTSVLCQAVGWGRVGKGMGMRPRVWGALVLYGAGRVVGEVEDEAV